MYSFIYNYFFIIKALTIDDDLQAGNSDTSQHAASSSSERNGLPDNENDGEAFYISSNGCYTKDVNNVLYVAHRSNNHISVLSRILSIIKSDEFSKNEEIFNTSMDIIICILADCLSNNITMNELLKANEADTLDTFINEAQSMFPLLKSPLDSEKEIHEKIWEMLRRNVDRDLADAVIDGLVERLNLNVLAKAINHYIGLIYITASENNMVKINFRKLEILQRHLFIKRHINTEFLRLNACIENKRDSTILPVLDNTDETILGTFNNLRCDMYGLRSKLCFNHFLYALVCCIGDCVEKEVHLKDYVKYSMLSRAEIKCVTDAFVFFKPIETEGYKEEMLNQHQIILNNPSELEDQWALILLSMCDAEVVMAKIKRLRDKQTNSISKYILCALLHILDGTEEEHER